MKPQIVFEPTIFSDQSIRNNKSRMDKVIASGDQLAKAFDALSKDPRWRDDPRLRDIDPATAAEVLDIYNDVIVDGRFVREFVDNPDDVLKKLKIVASREARAVIKAMGAGGGANATVVGAAVVVSISVVGAAVVTAIVSSHADRRARILIDESGRVKLGSNRVKARRKRVVARPGG